MKSVSQDITHYQAILSYAEKHGGANGCHHAPYVSTDLSIAYVSGVTLGGLLTTKTLFPLYHRLVLLHETPGLPA